MEYWLRIGPADSLPGRGHFDPIEIWDLVPNIWMVDVCGAPPRFKYRVAGTKVVEYIGHEPTGKMMDDVFPHFENTATFRDLNRVVAEKCPRWRRGTPTLRYDKDFKTVEQVSLPLANDGKTVDIVLNLTVFLNSQGVPC